MNKRFVLLHGAWHGGWCWQGVKENLEAKGHTCLTPTMPGHNADDSRDKIIYDSYVNAVAALLKKQPGKVILAGHSSAGHIMQCAAPLAADKIEKLVFVNAFILPHDHSQFDLVPPEVAQGMTAAAQASPDMSVPIDQGFVRNMLMQDASKEQQDGLISHLVPQPLALFTTKINTKPFSELDTPRVVIFCKDDQSLPPGAYLGMAQGLGDFKLIEVNGSHETLFINPPAVSDALLQAAE